MLVNKWLLNATTQLNQKGISSARLDAELLLSFVLKTSRAKLLASPELVLDKQQLVAASVVLGRRLKHEPLAYIRGFVEFYGLDFTVTPDVLIPRGESETLVEAAVHHIPKGVRLHDIGTGSGCLAIATKLHREDLTVSASDISSDALEAAKRNAKKLKCDINFIISDLFTDVGDVDAVLANLPYVPLKYPRSPETNHEPALALFAESNGLALYEEFFRQIPSSCKLILLESNPEQQVELKNMAEEDGFSTTKMSDFVMLCKKN